MVIDDDEPGSNIFSPPAVVDSLWNSYFANTGYTPSVVHYKEDLNQDTHLRKLALSDLQNYKLVIFHSERPDKTSNLYYENDAITLYLKQGGNMLITLTGQGAQSINGITRRSQNSMVQYFGMPRVFDAAQSITATSNAFLHKADGQQIINTTIEYPDIDVNLSGFNLIVNNNQGLYSVTYFPFTLTPGSNIMYKFTCKPTSWPVNPPSLAQYNLFNNKTIGVRTVTANNKCYLLGFPLSYMNASHAKEFIRKIVNEVMSPS